MNQASSKNDSAYSASIDQSQKLNTLENVIAGIYFVCVS